jgi:hypothetical protein
MKPGARGFLYGAVLAGAAMLVMPELVETVFRSGWRNRHLVEIVAVDGGIAGSLGVDAPIAAPSVGRTHVDSRSFAIDAERRVAHDFLPRAFSVRISGVERAMTADGRLCPIVVLATPDEIRISPCLARVAAK